ncbi:hypothetical protein SAMN02787144_101956 [Streptomyces atratus]|uniref:Peptidoglycan-binding protein n=2 Tax=Streptomyces atratus TaxID=1893 RepID=A0A1K2EF33_STRAR|nr:hypothetical protein SAMN02787144_101956 [Streptomyces atratus]
MKRMGPLSARTVLAVTASILLLAGTAQAAPAKYARHADAAAELKKAGITWTSSGNCSDWNKKTCTSFTQINKASVAGLIAFKKASGCNVIVTGGTEKGHASGTYSHRNGYKTDISTKVACVNNYITRKFAKAGTRSDGAALYKSPAKNVYANEGSHWDITHYNSKA